MKKRFGVLMIAALSIMFTFAMTLSVKAFVIEDEKPGVSTFDYGANYNDITAQFDGNTKERTAYIYTHFESGSIYILNKNERPEVFGVSDMLWDTSNPSTPPSEDCVGTYVEVTRGYPGKILPELDESEFRSKMGSKKYHIVQNDFYAAPTTPTPKPDNGGSNGNQPDKTDEVDEAERTATMSYLLRLLIPKSKSVSEAEAGAESVGKQPSQEACNHSYGWQTQSAPSGSSYGTEAYVCSKCGAVGNIRVKSPVDDKASSMIDNAKSGDTVVLDCGSWNSFPKWMLEKIAAKPTTTFIFKYTYMGCNFEVTIEPGTVMPLDCDYYGPLKMERLFGATITPITNINIVQHIKDDE